MTMFGRCPGCGVDPSYDGHLRGCPRGPSDEVVGRPADVVDSRLAALRLVEPPAQPAQKWEPPPIWAGSGPAAAAGHPAREAALPPDRRDAHGDGGPAV